MPAYTEGLNANARDLATDWWTVGRLCACRLSLSLIVKAE
jgi:hypothetical protein